MCNNNVITTIAKPKIACSVLSISRCCCSLEGNVRLSVSEKSANYFRSVSNFPACIHFLSLLNQGGAPGVNPQGADANTHGEKTQAEESKQ